jgi:hypothetical protein
MKKITFALLLLIMINAFAQKPAQADIDGARLGTLDAGSIKLRIVFHVTSSATGLAATMDSLDQGAKGIPVSSTAQWVGSNLRGRRVAHSSPFAGSISEMKES